MTKLAMDNYLSYHDHYSLLSGAVIIFNDVAERFEQLSCQ